MIKKRLVIWFLIVTFSGFLYLGCGDIQNSEDNEIVWGIPVQSNSFVDKTSLETNLSYLNEQLSEDGYNFHVSFLFIEGEDLYNETVNLLESGEIDIVFLGTGNIVTNDQLPKQLLTSELLFSLDDYLGSEEGVDLYQTFYEEDWDAVAVNGEICSIPNQTGGKGYYFAGFNKKFFSEDISYDGSAEELYQLVSDADLPEDVLPVLYGMVLNLWAPSLGYIYENGVFLDLDSGYAVCPYETEELYDCYKVLHEMYANDLIGFDYTNPSGTEAFYEEHNFAIWLGCADDYRLDSIKDDFILVQLPYAFSTTVNGSTGISKNSNQKESALQLLTLVYSDPVYANLLVLGEENKTYKMVDGYVCDLEGESLSSIYNCIITGAFDNVLAGEYDPFRSNRKDRKLYGTEAMRNSVWLGFLLDTADFNEKMFQLWQKSLEYDQIWMKDDLEGAFEQAVMECKEFGTEEVEALYESQFKEW